MFGDLSVMPILNLKQAAGGESLEIAVARLLDLTDHSEIVRWVQFPSAVLLFVVVPGDPESGAFYVFDRNARTWLWLDFADQSYGGYRLEDFERLVTEGRLLRLIEQPWLLECGGQWFVQPGSPLRCRFGAI